MWRKVNALENMVKSVISLSNATRRDVQSLNVAAQGAQHAQQHGRGYHARQPAPEPGLRRTPPSLTICPAQFLK